MLLKKAWVLVLPSIKEGFGLVLIEALACRTPVIAVNSGGPKDIIIDNVNGYLVPPRKITTLAEKIKHILTHDDLREYMGENGRKLVIDKFTWDKVAERVEKELYKAIEDFNKRYS